MGLSADLNLATTEGNLFPLSLSFSPLLPTSKSAPIGVTATVSLLRVLAEWSTHSARGHQPRRGHDSDGDRGLSKQYQLW